MEVVTIDVLSALVGSVLSAPEEVVTEDSVLVPPELKVLDVVSVTEVGEVDSAVVLPEFDELDVTVDCDWVVDISEVAPLGLVSVCGVDVVSEIVVSADVTPRLVVVFVDCTVVDEASEVSLLVFSVTDVPPFEGEVEIKIVVGASDVVTDSVEETVVTLEVVVSDLVEGISDVVPAVLDVSRMVLKVLVVVGEVDGGNIVPTVVVGEVDGGNVVPTLVVGDVATVVPIVTVEVPDCGVHPKINNR